MCPIERNSQELENYQRKDGGTDWIEKNWGSLPADRWIAANQGGEVAIAQDIDTLMGELTRKNVSKEDVTIVYINPLPA